MKKTVVLLLVFFSLTVYSHAFGDFNFEKNLTVARGQVYRDNLVSWNGNISVSGNLAESIFMIGGQLDIAGTVEKDVICIGTRVNLKKNALIKGEMLLIGGKQSRHADAQIKGEYFYFKFNLKKVESTLYPIISDSGSLTFFRIAKIIIWFVITLLVFMLVPQKVTAARNLFAPNIFKTGLTGIIAVIVFIILLMISIVLSFILIGIPMVFALVAVYFALLVFGRTTLFYFWGCLISHAFAKRIVNPVTCLIIGAAVYGCLKFIPVAGPFILSILNILELGIAIGFFMRKSLYSVSISKN